MAQVLKTRLPSEGDFHQFQDSLYGIFSGQVTL